MKKITIALLALFIGANGLFSQDNWEWTEQESGTTEQLLDVFFINNTTGWVVGNNGIILKTSNGGVTWATQTSNTDQQLSSIHFIDENTGWITGGGVTAQAAPMLKTTDGGENWDDLAYGFDAYFINDIFFVNENVGWALKSDSIYRSTDGGNTWLVEDYGTTVTVSSLNNKEIFATSDTIAYVAGRNDNGSSTTVATVFDRRPQNAYLWGTDGLNQFDIDDALNSITFANDSVGFVGGQMGKLYKMEGSTITPNNGPWNLNLDLQNNTLVRSISFPNSNVGMFNISIEIGSETLALVYHTENQGETWTSSPDTISNMLSAKLFAADIENAWMVAIGGNIYKGVPAPSSIFNNHTKINIVAYPNPTSGLLTINNPDGYSKLTISIVNLTGQLISEYVMENTASMEVNIDGNPGIYFVKATNEKGGQRVIKVIKE